MSDKSWKACPRCQSANVGTPTCGVNASTGEMIPYARCLDCGLDCKASIWNDRVAPPGTLAVIEEASSHLCDGPLLDSEYVFLCLTGQEVNRFLEEWGVDLDVDATEEKPPVVLDKFLLELAEVLEIDRPHQLRGDEGLKGAILSRIWRLRQMTDRSVPPATQGLLDTLEIYRHLGKLDSYTAEQVKKAREEFGLGTGGGDADAVHRA